MKLVSFKHKGLQNLVEKDSSRGVPAAMVPKLKRQLTAMSEAGNLDDLKVFPGWRLHPLKGPLAGLWSLVVTGNWRLIFGYDAETNEADVIDLVDYHGE